MKDSKGNGRFSPGAWPWSNWPTSAWVTWASIASDQDLVNVVRAAPLPTLTPKPVMDRICKRLQQGARLALRGYNDCILLDDQDDIAVEISIKLWTKIHTFNGKSLITWSKVSAVNLVSKRMRSKKHLRVDSQAVENHSDNNSKDAIARAISADVGPAETAMREEIRQRLWEAIDDLEPELRLVARIWFEAKTIEETALKTGLNSCAVVSRRRRIRKVFLAKWGKDPLGW